MTSSITRTFDRQSMARENKILRMFRFLTDKYDAKAGRNVGSRDGERPLTVVLTVYGQRMIFNSTDDDFRIFIVQTAREELGEAFSLANIKDLNLQLETIAIEVQEPEHDRKDCACGCPVDEPIDDE
jgi:hypothetical protein